MKLAIYVFVAGLLTPILVSALLAALAYIVVIMRIANSTRMK